jgi:hypothetical protein
MALLTESIRWYVPESLLHQQRNYSVGILQRVGLKLFGMPLPITYEIILSLYSLMTYIIPSLYSVKFFWHIFSVYKINSFLFLFLLTELLTRMKLPTNDIPTDRFHP